MKFASILFDNAALADRVVRQQAPEFFTDLNLDQIVDAVTASRKEYDLACFFHSPLTDIEEIAYRHEVTTDLEDAKILDRVSAFAQTMRSVREKLAQSAKLYYRYQKQWWFLDAVDAYCQGVQSLRDDLRAVDVRSRGFAGLRAYLEDYAASARFTPLGRRAGADQVRAVADTLLLSSSGAARSRCGMPNPNPTTAAKWKPPSRNSPRERPRTTA